MNRPESVLDAYDLLYRARKIVAPMLLEHICPGAVPTFVQFNGTDWVVSYCPLPTKIETLSFPMGCVTAENPVQFFEDWTFDKEVEGIIQTERSATGNALCRALSTIQDNEWLEANGFTQDDLERPPFEHRSHWGITAEEREAAKQRKDRHTAATNGLNEHRHSQEYRGPLEDLAKKYDLYR